MRAHWILVGLAIAVALPARADDIQTARELLAEGKHREAEAALRAVVKDPNTDAAIAADAYYAWYQSLREREGAEGEPQDREGKNAERALRKLELAAKLASDRADWRLELGRYRAQLGHIDEAMSDYVQALMIDPSFAQAHRALAEALIDKGLKPEAEAQLHEALRINPRDETAWAMLCELVLDRGPVLEALQLAEQGIEKRPDSPALLRTLGRVYEHAGETSKAEGAYEKLVDLTPRDADAHLKLGHVRRRRGDDAGALTAFRRAKALAPGDPTADIAMAWIYAETPGRAGLALQLAQRALKLAPDDPEAAAAKGWALHKSRRTDQAIQTLTAAATTNPGSPHAMYYLGVIAKDGGKSEESVSWLRRAVAEGTGTPITAKARALLTEMGETEPEADSPGGTTIKPSAAQDRRHAPILL